MQTTPEVYQSPLVTRYASSSMGQLFSSYNTIHMWRKVWIALAKAQQKVGLPITNLQINELEAQCTNINFEAIARYEKRFKHDVMANIHAYADLCPTASPIIHLGATSCTITDNAELIIIRSALKEIKKKLIVFIKALRTKAVTYKNLPCLGFTHGQTAQPTTVGKRIAGWLQDILIDFSHLEYGIEHLYFLGLKGATGTQASFLELLDGNHEKVRQLELFVAQELGFDKVLPISGQTYTRKQDVSLLHVLSDIAVSAHKMSTDIRLLASMKEIQEPFEENQVGSTAMPYKRNPMKCERVCSLARYVMALAENPKYTASVQWFERTLDDSANRRLCIPESFLAIDGIMRLLITVVDGIVVNEDMIRVNLEKEFPFLAIEYMLMRCVQKGADRQEIHEYIREHSMKSYKTLAKTGVNTLFEQVTEDDRIPLNKNELTSLHIEHFIGRAPEQVDEFIRGHVDPVIEAQSESLESIEPPEV